MKILFCDNSIRELLNFRGDIIYHYAESGYEVILVAPETKNFTPENSNIRYIPVDMNRSGKNLLQELRYFNTLRKIYQRERPDYIFHYTIKANIYGTLAAAICKIPSSAVITGLGYVFNSHGLSSIVARNLYKFALKFSQCVFVLNTSNEQFLLKNKFVCKTKLIYLPGGEGVNLERFSPQGIVNPDKKIIFLMIARLLYDKGYAEYVETARFIKEKYVDVEFRILGAIDKCYPNCVPEEIVERDHTRGWIRYLGMSSDVVPEIQSADCVILPSYHEGLSRVLMEAIAMGKPVIASDIPGCRETIDQDVNGFLVKSKDTHSLSIAVEKFILMPYSVRQEMGKLSRLKAEKEFDIRRVINIYKKITDTGLNIPK